MRVRERVLPTKSGIRVVSKRIDEGKVVNVTAQIFWIRVSDDRRKLHNLAFDSCTTGNARAVMEIRYPATRPWLIRARSAT